MKNVIRVLFNACLMIDLVVILVVGSLAAVFALEHEDPDNIFLFGYALCFENSDDGSTEIWVLKEVDGKEDITSPNENIVLFYNRKYVDAYALSVGTETEYRDADDPSVSYSEFVNSSPDKIVGQVLLQWEIKR